MPRRTRKHYASGSIVSASIVQPPSVPTPEIVIQPGGVILHVGPPSTMTIEEIRARKTNGQKLIWVLTKEEQDKFTPLFDEAVFGWKSDDQLRRVLHDQMHLWVGAEVLPPGNEKVEKIAGIMAELAALHQFNESSNVVLGKDNLPARNSFKNFHWSEIGVPIKRVKGIGNGKPVVCLAAGPSLNDQWPYLREYRKKHPDVPFIMAGRTYKKAMQEGVWPEFVVEVEQYDWDADLFMFAPEPPPHSVLAFPITAAPKLAQVWPGPKMCMLNHNLAQLMGLTIGEDSVDGGNSVLHYMVILAGLLGSSPIYLGGVDFGYPKGREEDTHASGTFHKWPADVLNVEHVHQGEMQLPANDGGTIMSSTAYQAFGTYLAVQVQKLKEANAEQKVYTFSKRGLKVAGVEYTDIGEWAK